MKIFQISDLHLDENFKMEEYSDMLEEMANIIEHESKEMKNIYIVCCGDIVNKGDPKEYGISAISVFDFFKDKLKDKTIEFICVPGNHDLCNNEFVDFQTFFSRCNKGIDFNTNNVSIYETPSLDYLLLNTTFHKDITYGNIDLIKLKEHLTKTSKPVIIIMHHTLMSRYSNDRSQITNAYEFLKQLHLCHCNILKTHPLPIGCCPLWNTKK